MKKTVGATLALLASLAMFAAPSASAATTVGSNCPATTSVAEATFISLKNPPGYPLPSAIPSAGVITSWTFDIGVPLSFPLSEQLKVFAPAGPNQYTVVGESTPVPVTTGITTSPTRISVKSGELLGAVALTGASFGSVYCLTENPGDEVVVVPGMPTLGSTLTGVVNLTKAQNPITVKVEPDADGDGYGDETQDQCPTNAASQAPCPAPPTPIALSATAAAKQSLVTVTLTASAQATVTVGGSVKLGGGKSATLTGGTQVVAPATLAQFTVPFPSKLKKKLKQTPTSKKLTLSLSATAPGATSTAVTVKVKGQKKPKKHPKH